MSACIQISQMMWDSLLGDGGLLDALEQNGPAPAPAQPRAHVLPFRRPN
jgi:hypothetical protein